MEMWYFSRALNDRYNFIRRDGGGHLRRSQAFKQRHEVKTFTKARI